MSFLKRFKASVQFTTFPFPPPQWLETFQMTEAHLVQALENRHHGVETPVDPRRTGV